MNVRSFASSPAGYLEREPVSGSVLVFLVLVAIASVKRGALPSQREAVALAFATVALAIAASFAPRVVTLFLLAAAVIMTARNASAISDLVSRGFGRVQAAVS